jgi:hypothetical protein
MRQWLRVDYLRQHAQARRAADKAAGARRIDVTLRGRELADYATVRRHIEGMERLLSERWTRWPQRRRAISDSEVIRHALNWAAERMREADQDAAAADGMAAGMVQILAD